MTSKKSSVKHGSHGKVANNKPFWYEPHTGRFFDKKVEVPKDKPSIEYWDSILEFQVYHQLLKVVSCDRIQRQQSIPILIARCPFPAWNWNIDFVVDGIFLIEAKGRWLLQSDQHRKNFVQTLRVLQETNPRAFDSLILVDKTKWVIPGTKLEITSLSSLVNTLQEKMKGKL